MLLFGDGRRKKQYIMKWAKRLFISDEAKQKKTRTIWKLKRGKSVFGVYVITLSANPANQLDIFESSSLMNKRYPKDDLVVVGIAKGYDDALELVNKMAQKTVDITGDTDIRAFVRDYAGID